MPWLAALVCASPIDLALHDAFGHLLGRPTYTCYSRETLAHDLSHYLEPAEDSQVRFAGRYPSDYLVPDLPESLPVWHLVGGLDPLDSSELGETSRTTGIRFTCGSGSGATGCPA